MGDNTEKAPGAKSSRRCLENAGKSLMRKYDELEIFVVGGGPQGHESFLCKAVVMTGACGGLDDSIEAWISVLWRSSTFRLAEAGVSDSFLLSIPIDLMESSYH